MVDLLRFVHGLVADLFRSSGRVWRRVVMSVAARITPT
jgi:hypothetical protein